MSFFSWFSKKPPAATSLASGSATRSSGGLLPASSVSQGTQAVQPLANPHVETNPANVDRKVMRHARREQLYAAIRDAMTRAGLLSASYKFKVLSLDQNGNQFLVMLDMAQGLVTSAEQLSQAEDILVQTAMAGHGIVVTSVYWRVDRKPPPKLATANATAKVPATAPPALVAMLPVDDEIEDDFPKTQADPSEPLVHDRVRAADVVARAQAIPSLPNTKNRHDPLLEAEVAAFKRALTAAPVAVVAPAARASVMPAANPQSKARSGSKSYTLITGFEDTEMPDSPAIPALSATQYGDLN